MNYLYKGNSTSPLDVSSKSNVKDETIDYAKSNFIISSVYKSTLIENQILAIALSEISKATEDKEGSLIVKLEVKDIKKLLNLNGNSIYENLEKTAVGLVTGRAVGIVEPEKHSFSYVSLITKAEYSKGVFSIRFAPEMRSFLKDLEKNFTILNRNYMLNFSSVYSFRLYELLKSKCYYYKNKEKNETKSDYSYDISLSELKFKMGIIDGNEPRIIKYLEKTGKNSLPDYSGAEKLAKTNMYSQYGDFRRECLNPAVAEINNKTDLNVEYKGIRKGVGGKTVGISFAIRLTTKNHKDRNIYDCQNINRTPLSKDEMIEKLL